MDRGSRSRDRGNRRQYLVWGFVCAALLPLPQVGLESRYHIACMSLASLALGCRHYGGIHDTKSPQDHKLSK
jgi:hypothetical protein